MKFFRIFIVPVVMLLLINGCSDSKSVSQPISYNHKKHISEVGLTRITSYNVCYTKLLRGLPPGDPAIPAGSERLLPVLPSPPRGRLSPGGIRVDRFPGRGQQRRLLPAQGEGSLRYHRMCVITSYSIHYTKLYDQYFFLGIKLIDRGIVLFKFYVFSTHAVDHIHP